MKKMRQGKEYGSMTKTIKLLSHGLFEKPFMDSRVKSRTLSKKEEILGHLDSRGLACRDFGCFSEESCD